jgi:hypothetical protein
VLVRVWVSRETARVVAFESRPDQNYTDENKPSTLRVMRNLDSIVTDDEYILEQQWDGSPDQFMVSGEVMYNPLPWHEEMRKARSVLMQTGADMQEWLAALWRINTAGEPPTK